MSSIEKSNTGLWLKRVSIFAILLLPLALLGYRLNLYLFQIASKLLAASLLLASVTFLLSVMVSIKQRHSSPASSKQASLASCISLVPLLFLGSQIAKAVSLPMIHNISTDVIDPPAFDKIIALRGANSNAYTYDKESLAELQQSAYPEVKTLIVEQTQHQAYEESLRVAKLLGWNIVNEDPVNNFFEASQTSILWGFTDDVVVRVSLNNGQTEVDLRSVSRVGRSDLGANAKRITYFLEKYAQ